MSAIHLRVVLVRPRNPLNIGAAARAMANFGFSDLVAVKPYAPSWRETKSAVGAEKLVLDARSLDSLDEAISDCHLVVGTTVVRDRAVERPVVPLPDLKSYLEKIKPSPLLSSADGVFRVAVLFGSEKTGLAGTSLDKCHFWLTIPTDPGCPSMNLGQSVALVCYQWAQVLGKTIRPVLGESSLATQDHRRRLAEHAHKVFDAANFLPFMPKATQEKKLQRLFLHWNLGQRDVQLIHGALRFILQRLKGGKK